MSSVKVGESFLQNTFNKTSSKDEVFFLFKVRVSCQLIILRLLQMYLLPSVAEAYSQKNSAIRCIENIAVEGYFNFPYKLK